MKKSFFIIVLFFITYYCMAQPFYSKITTPDIHLSSYSLGNLIFKNDTLIFNTYPIEEVVGEFYANTYLTKYLNDGQLISTTKLGVESKRSKILMDEDKLLTIGTFKESTRDSLQILLIDGNDASLILEIFNPYGYLSLKSHYQFLKYKTQYLIFCSGEYFYLNKNKEYKPYIIWINNDFTLDTVMQLDLPYGELFDYGIDDDGHLNILAQYHSDKHISGPNTTKNYQGYIKIDGAKNIKHTYFEEQKHIKYPFTKDPQGVFYPDGTKIMTGPYGDELRIIAMGKNDQVLWQDSTYRDQNLKYNEHVSYAKCQNGDLIVLARNIHKTGLSDSKDQFETSFIQRYDKDGKEKFFRSYGYYNKTYGKSEGNWLYDIKEMFSNNILAVGAIASRDPHAIYPGQLLNDSTWILSVDSMGCIDKDKCNDVIVWRAPNNLYQYDQINVRHKEWYFSNDKGRYVQSFGRDTNMFDRPKYGWLRYRPIIYKNLDTGAETKDTVFATWAPEGRLYISPRNFNPFGALRIHPLYDFTLKLHDTFTLPYGFGQAKVVQVDSIAFIPGYIRKRIILKHLNPTNQAKYGDLTWIEGIGSPNGILYYKDWQEGTKTALTCYYDRGEKRYSSTNDPDCMKEVLESAYKNVLSPSHIWYTSESSGWTPGSYNARNKIDSDTTLIGSHYYFPVLSSLDSTGNHWYSMHKYVREEAGRLWVLDSTHNNNEILIMDINLNKGDEFPYIDGLGRAMKLFVNKADTIIDLSGQSRKVLYLSCAENEAFRYRWIEGVGTDVGVFSSTFNHCVVDGNENNLTCFYLDGVQIWQSEDFAYCWISPSVIDTTDMDRSAIWYSSSYTGNFADGDCKLKIDITKVVRDTTINDRLCRILGVFSAGEYLPESEVITFQKDGKLYFYENDIWKLLYDFTAQAGDTVTYYISEKYPYYFKYAVPGIFDQEIMDRNPYQLLIEKIDTLYTTEGNPLMRFYTKSLDERQTNRMGVIIENVGSEFKLFGLSTIISLPECLNNFPSLRCYSDDDIFVTFTEEECDKLTSAKDVSHIMVNVYPNPGGDNIIINLGGQVDMPLTCKVTDISGKIVFSDVEHLSGFELNTNQLRSGMYIIRLMDKSGKVWQGKWVKD